MRKISRQILLFVAIGIFVIVAPLLVLYAMGYRYDFKNFKPTKVGMLIIEATPKNVSMYLNNKLVNIGTSYKNSSLTPGNYKIKITKDGFSTWKKTLPVKSRQVNWASHVKLFYTNPAISQVIEKNKYDNFVLLPNKQKLFLVSNEQDNKGIFSYDIKSNTTIKFFPKKGDEAKYDNSTFSDLSVSAGGKYTFFSVQNPFGDKNYLVANPDKSVTLNTIFTNPITNPTWSKKDSSLIYWVSNNSLYSYNADSSSLPVVSVDGVYNFAVNNDFVYIAKKENNKTVIKRGREGNLQNADFLFDSPENLEITKMKAGVKSGFAFETSNNVLYLMKFDEKNSAYFASKIFDNPKDFAWSNLEDKLLYYNSSEIWFYELVNKLADVPVIHPEYKVDNANLAIRDQNIDKVIWYPDLEHVLYSKDSKIHVVELDERSTKNTSAFNTFEINNFAVTEKGDYIIFLDKNNNLFHAKITDYDGLF